MQPMPLLARQTLRTAFSRPVIKKPRSVPNPAYSGVRQSQTICLRCQIRAQGRLYSIQREQKPDSISPAPNGPTDTARALDASQPTSTSDQAAQHETTRSASDNLPSASESRRSSLSKRFTHIMDNLQSNIFLAGQRLNDLTGYSGIEALRKDIEKQEQLVQTYRRRVREAKDAYSAAIALRSRSQREVNELLQRKNSWTPTDLERFTSLYRSDHANEQAELKAQEALSLAERNSEEASTKLGRSILARYHEEQIWSDKIRRMSTWGTWGLMGVNVLLFLVFQVAVEPWRRQRLVKGFEDKVMEALEKENTTNAVKTESNELGVQSDIIAAVDAIEPTDEEAIPPAKEQLEELPPPISDAALPGTESYKDVVRELFSEKQVSMTQKEATTLALEGAAAGAALTGFLLVLLRPK